MAPSPPPPSAYPFWPTMLYTVGVFLALYLAVVFLRWLAAKNDLIMGMRIGIGRAKVGYDHHWTPGGIFLPLYCSLCGSLLVGAASAKNGSGKSSSSAPSTSTSCYLCSDCGLATCLSEKCLLKAVKEVKCKEVARHRPTQQKASTTAQASTDEDEGGGDEKEVKPPPFVHHWVSGNLPLMSECEACEQTCGDSTHDEDLRCAWCQRYGILFPLPALRVHVSSSYYLAEPFTRRAALGWATSATSATLPSSSCLRSASPPSRE